MDKNRQALIAVNEAISALDYAPPESEARGALDEVTDWLLEIRRTLTGTEYPAHLPIPQNHPLASAHWFAKHEADQIADGRL